MRYIIALLVLLFAAGASAQVTYTETPIQAPLQFVNETGTPLNLGDDNTRLIPLDFSFTFFGNTYNSVYISSNGFLSFTNSANGCCNGNPETAAEGAERRRAATFRNLSRTVGCHALRRGQ